MGSAELIVKLLVLHYIADFILQPREMGKNKSVRLEWLACHLLIQFLVFFPFFGIKFAAANCLVHGVIDWFIWRGYKAIVMWRIKRREKLYGEGGHPLYVYPKWNGIDYPKPQPEWKYWDDSAFYDTIGLDQLLHASTLILLARYLL